LEFPSAALALLTLRRRCFRGTVWGRGPRGGDGDLWCCGAIAILEVRACLELVARLEGKIVERDVRSMAPDGPSTDRCRSPLP